MTRPLNDEVIQATDRAKLNVLAIRHFHYLWGRDKELPGYDKDRWMALQSALLKLGVKV